MQLVLQMHHRQMVIAFRGKVSAEDPDAQPRETFANLFGLFAFGDEKQIAFLTQNFPDVVREFEAIEL